MKCRRQPKRLQQSVEQCFILFCFYSFFCFTKQHKFYNIEKKSMGKNVSAKRITGQVLREAESPAPGQTTSYAKHWPTARPQSTLLPPLSFPCPRHAINLPGKFSDFISCSLLLLSCCHFQCFSRVHSDVFLQYLCFIHSALVGVIRRDNVELQL